MYKEVSLVRISTNHLILLLIFNYSFNLNSNINLNSSIGELYSMAKASSGDLGDRKIPCGDLWCDSQCETCKIIEIPLWWDKYICEAKLDELCDGDENGKNHAGVCSAYIKDGKIRGYCPKCKPAGCSVCMICVGEMKLGEKCKPGYKQGKECAISISPSEDYLGICRIDGKCCEILDNGKQGECWS